MRAARRLAVNGTVLAVAVATGPGPASAKGGAVGGTGSQYFLNDSFTGTAGTIFNYGTVGDEVYVGDWDGNGTDTLAVRRGNIFYVKNSLTGGGADTVFAYGRPGDTVLVGDWDGDGTDTLAVRRGNVYYVKNSISSGVADAVFAYGRAGDAVLVGDWNGDGVDTLAVRRGNVYYVKNSISTGVADAVFAYGRAADTVLVGDWDGNRTDTLAVRRGNTYYLRNSLTSGPADKTVAYGRATDTTLVGDWNGDGVDTLGVRRPPPPPGQDWLGEINKYRSAAGLSPVTDDPAWDTGIHHHNTYLLKTPPNYFTGVYQSWHSENPASPYYTADGALEGARSDISFGGNYTPVASIDEWLAAPFHAVGILRPELQKVAYATDGLFAGLDVLGGLTGSSSAPGPVLFPGPGMTTDLRSYSGGELPSPLETCGWTAGSSYGLPLIALLPSAPAAGATATVTGSNGSAWSSTAGSLCLVDEHTYHSSDPVYGPNGLALLQSDHAVFLIVRAPYGPGTYAATINQPGASPIRWTFRVS
jgi:hypothetical protein